MLEGSPKNVEAAVKQVIVYAGEGGALIVCPGCDLNPDIPAENLVALVEATKKYGSYV